MNYEIQVSTCGNTLWINAEDGSSIARFSKRFGMDVHNSTTDQLEGKPQCLHCTHIKPTLKDWITFRQKILEHFNIELPLNLIKFKPSYIKLGESHVKNP